MFDYNKGLELFEIFLKENPKQVKSIWAKIKKQKFEGPTIDEYFNSLQSNMDIEIIGQPTNNPYFAFDDLDLFSINESQFTFDCLEEYIMLGRETYNDIINFDSIEITLDIAECKRFHDDNNNVVKNSENSYNSDDTPYANAA